MQIFKSRFVQTVGLAVASTSMFLVIGYALLGGFTHKETASDLTPAQQAEIEKIQAERAEYYAKKEPVELTAKQKIKVKLFDAEWTVLRLTDE
ncbi:hypothetical protein [Priestia megaterium]|uniref:hypothetical protein n=1 Tax=Priestia megaterium TaxID=1404 RepID=UPI002E20674E|nr:hypothetical protein [Priestia megaterium]MED4278289.1 hypothetical protein [Priestia megaterium]MED4314394.1 hypothetical protein [Priestia megaterium]